MPTHVPSPSYSPGLLISCWPRLGHGVSLRFVRRDRGFVVAGAGISGSEDGSGRLPRLSWPGALEIARKAGEQYGIRTCRSEGARDRAGAYADGIRQDAPKAVQVSDRWHLLRNLGDAVRAVVDRHHGALRRAAQQMDEPMPGALAEEAASEPAVRRATAAQRRSQDAHARRHSRYQEAARLRSAGRSISGIADVLGVERKTIRRWLAAGRAPIWSMPPREGILTSHLARLIHCRSGILWRV